MYRIYLSGRKSLEWEYKDRIGFERDAMGSKTNNILVHEFITQYSISEQQYFTHRIILGY